MSRDREIEQIRRRRLEDLEGLEVSPPIPQELMGDDPLDEPVTYQSADRELSAQPKPQPLPELPEDYKKFVAMKRQSENFPRAYEKAMKPLSYEEFGIANQVAEAPAKKKPVELMPESEDRDPAWRSEMTIEEKPSYESGLSPDMIRDYRERMNQVNKVGMWANLFKSRPKSSDQYVKDHIQQPMLDDMKAQVDIDTIEKTNHDKTRERQEETAADEALTGSRNPNSLASKIEQMAMRGQVQRMLNFAEENGDAEMMAKANAMMEEIPRMSAYDIRVARGERPFEKPKKVSARKPTSAWDDFEGAEARTELSRARVKKIDADIDRNEKNDARKESEDEMKRMERYQKTALNHKMTQDAEKVLKASMTIDRMIDEAYKNGGVAPPALGALMAKINGEVGVLTNQDVTRYVQNKALHRRLIDASKEMFSGKITRAKAQDLRRVVQVLQAKARDQRAAAYKQVGSQYGRVTGKDEKTALSVVDPSGEMTTSQTPQGNSNEDQKALQWVKDPANQNHKAFKSVQEKLRAKGLLK